MLEARLYHDKHWDFVQDDEGEFILGTSTGPKNYKRVPVEAEGGFTDLAFPADYDATTERLSHLVQSLTSRNASAADVVSVSGGPGAEDVVALLADMLDAAIIDHPEPPA